MTNPTFKYNPDTHCLDEVAREKKPVWNPEIWEYWFEFEEAERKYNAHTSTLRHIKCEPGSVWPVGEIPESDFSLQHNCVMKGRCDCQKNGDPLHVNEDCLYSYAVAIPINREEGDSISMLKKIHFDMKHFENHGMSEDFINNYLSKFTITRKP